MNIKSLLLGSAAALLVVSGSRAADAAVVAEPEPIEYVRICDVYGAGFYYIPGTKTCLKIGSLVRYEIDWTDENKGWKKTALARFKFDARSETEYGTFRRYIEFQAGIGGGGWQPKIDDGHPTGENVWVGTKSESASALKDAYLELGGLLVGYTDSLFYGDLSGEFDRGGGGRINQIRYIFDAGNGVSIAAGLEEESDNFDYVPLIVGKVSVAQGWGSVDLFAGYDDAYGGLVLKGITNIQATDAFTVQLLAAYESGPTFWGLRDAYDGYAWSVGGYLKYQFSEKLTVGFGSQYFADHHFGGTIGKYTTTGDGDWAVGTVVDYNIIENLDAKIALNYSDGKSEHYGDGVLGGFLRLEASF